MKINFLPSFLAHMWNFTVLQMHSELTDNEEPGADFTWWHAAPAPAGPPSLQPLLLLVDCGYPQRHQRCNETKSNAGLKIIYLLVYMPCCLCGDIMTYFCWILIKKIYILFAVRGKPGPSHMPLWYINTGKCEFCRHCNVKNSVYAQIKKENAWKA